MAAQLPPVGVLALQGSFQEHCQALRRAGAEPVEARGAAPRRGRTGFGKMRREPWAVSSARGQPKATWRPAGRRRVVAANARGAKRRALGD